MPDSPKRSKMPGKSSRILALVAILLSIPGCGGVPLTAPEGVVLQITASPLSIPIVDGVSNVTVIASKADADGGGPVADGTQIFFTMPIGVIEERVETRSLR